MKQGHERSWYSVARTVGGYEGGFVAHFAQPVKITRDYIFWAVYDKKTFQTFLHREAWLLE